LAHHGVELAIVEGKSAGVALGPGHSRLDALGHGEHAGTDVEPGHRSRRPNSTEGLTSDHAGAARHIEHHTTGGHTRGVEHWLGPLSEQRIDVQSLVGPRSFNGWVQFIRHGAPFLSSCRLRP